MATDGYAAYWNAEAGSPAYAAADFRRLDSMDQMPGSSAAPFSGRGGRRVNGAGLYVAVSSTGNGSVTVSPGAGRIYDSAYASQGAWDYEVAAQIGPITLGARPSSGQSRIDLVIARIYDKDLSVGTVRELKIEVIAGSPGTSPSAPTVPALSHVLETLTVPSSGTISSTRSTAVAVSAGGVLPVATTAERDALVTSGIAYPGLVIFNAQTKEQDTYTGTGWLRDADTGTIDLTLQPDWTAVADQCRYKRKSGIITVTVNANRASFVDAALIAVLPAGFRPDTIRYVTGQKASSPRYFSIGIDGGIRAVGAGTTGIAGSDTFTAA